MLPAPDFKAPERSPRSQPGQGWRGFRIWDRLKALGPTLWRNVPGGRSGQLAIIWAGVIHIIVLVICAFIVALPKETETPEIVAEVIVPERNHDLRMKQLSAMKQIGEASTSASASVARMVKANSAAVVAAPEVTIYGSGMVGFGMGELGQGFGTGAGGQGRGGMGVNTIPKTMRGRCIPGERTRLLQENGGSPAVEEAVVRSLNWLQSQQSTEGSWGATYPGAMTGLALLCYLGHCETVQSSQYGETVANGIAWMIETAQRNQGRIGIVEQKQWSYEHGIATYALGEALALMSEGGASFPELKDTYEKAVEIIISGQNHDGGWVYAYTQEGAGDLSVTGWQFQALKTAAHIRARAGDLSLAMNKATSFIAGRQGPEGGFGYRKKEDRHSLTGVGILGLQFLAKERGKHIQQAFDYFFAGGPFEYNGQECNIYSWYYFTQASFNHGGDVWHKWNGILRDQLLEHQDKSGYFPPEGSGISSRAKLDADIYRTCLCTLMLEVYYRYLPATG